MRCLPSMDFWLDMGVDGLRLDAVPYLYRARRHQLRKSAGDARCLCSELRAHVDEQLSADRMLLAEANQWPEDAVAYFGAGR